MAVDIFKPQVSKVIKGLDGKLILIYGTNRTGKTLNAVKSNKPFVVGFERGLNAISGIPYVPISSWKDWTDTVKQLTGARKAEVKELYSTIIIDTIDSMGSLASDHICQLYGCDTVGSGNRGYGYWKEYGDEIQKWLRLLTNAGYTVVFIGHEGTREMQDEKGVKYDKIYPRGEKRVVDPIADICDFICYAQVQPLNEKGEQINSTLYLQGTRAFHAGTRFKYVPAFIPEWTMDKLETVIGEAVTAEEKESGVKAVTFEDNKKTVEEATKSKWADKTLEELKAMCVEKGGASINARGGSPEWYLNLLLQEFGTRDFIASKATEQQRPQIEQLLDALIAAGY